MKGRESKVISIRCAAEVADRFEALCASMDVTKSEGGECALVLLIDMMETWERGEETDATD